MEFENNSGLIEPVTQVSIQDKIQKLIDNFSILKEKYKTLKEDYEKVLASNIELDDEKNQWINEKTLLEQKVLQLTDELKNKVQENQELKTKHNEYDIYSKTAALKIDDLLSNLDFDV